MNVRDTPKVLFSDNLHFNKKTWNSLFAFCKKNNLSLEYVREHRELQGAMGNYRDCKEKINDFIELIPTEKNELRSFKFNGFEIWNLIYAEVLSFALVPIVQTKQPISKSSAFDYLYENHFNDLVLNFSAACFWIDFWIGKLSLLNECKYVFIFSGSKIYAKTLFKILPVTSCTPIVMEYFSSGCDYFLENKFQHIANNSLYKNNRFYSQDLVKLNEQEKDISNEFYVIKKRYAQNLNINVRQPPINSIYPRFGNKERTVLIVGQVLNDFSIVESAIDEINSLIIYVQLIKNILNNTKFNVIFKGHPWERKKNNLNGIPVTLISLKSELDLLSEEERSRVYLTESTNISQLFSISDSVVTLCSQAGIDAAFFGFKPIIFFDSFYGRKGFTFDVVTNDYFVKLLQSDVSTQMTISEYASFMRFMVLLYRNNLISVDRDFEKIKKILPLNNTRRIESENIGSKNFTWRKLKKLLTKPRKFFYDSERKSAKIVSNFFKYF